MRATPTLLVLVLATPCAWAAQNLANPAVDVDAYRADVAAATLARAERLVSEDEFIRMARQPDTVIIDARSRAKYGALHVRGAINLSFPDLTVASLAAAMPDRYTALYTDGYRNVYELAPLLSVATTRIELEGSPR